MKFKLILSIALLAACAGSAHAAAPAQSAATAAEAAESDAACFDIRDFHAEVLGQGDLPLDILEQRIDAWIARVAATAATARLR